MAFIRKTKDGGVLVELGPKNINKVTFCEAVKGLLGEKALVSILEPTCSLEIRDLDCLTEKNEVEEAIKCECPEVTNVRIGITSAKSRGQKFAVMEAAEQSARKKSCLLCRDYGATDESVALTAGSGRCPVFRAELERARTRAT